MAQYEVKAFARRPMTRTNVKFTPKQLETRRPVWDALSSMYLDTDISLLRRWRVEILSSSPYTIDDIEFILRNEIHPVCFRNLLHPFGEWAGFDEVWLEQKICAPGHWFPKFQLKISEFLFFPSAEWKATRQGIALMRISAD